MKLELEEALEKAEEVEDLKRMLVRNKHKEDNSERFKIGTYKQNNNNNVTQQKLCIRVGRRQIILRHTHPFNQASAQNDIKMLKETAKEEREEIQNKTRY